MGRLHELIRLHIKLKPRLTRQFHLGIEKQSFAGFDICNFPKVESITKAEFPVQPSAAIESVAADKLIHKTAKPPEKIVSKPAMRPADRTGGIKNILRSLAFLEWYDAHIT